MTLRDRVVGIIDNIANVRASQGRAWFAVRRSAFFKQHVLSDARRTRNFLFAQAGRRFKPAGALRYVPYRLDIEPTTHCNFRCGHCQVSQPDWTSRHMKLDDFKGLIDRNPEVIQIKLQGMGEPFINRQFLDMAGHARSRGVYVSAFTNGSALTSKVIDRITGENSIQELSISIDGASKDVFEKIRVKSDFERVIANARELIRVNKLLPPSRRMLISAWSVIQDQNAHEVDQIIELVASMGFDRLIFQTAITDWGKTEYQSNKTREVDFTAVQQKRMQKKATELGLWFQLYRAGSIPEGGVCAWPFESLYVGATMDVAPCCLVADPGVANMGSLRERSIAEIWNTGAMREARAAHLGGKAPSYCDQCYKSSKSASATPAAVVREIRPELRIYPQKVSN